MNTWRRVRRSMLPAAATVMAMASPAAAQDYGVRTFAIVSGAGTATGGPYDISATIGQAGAGPPMADGIFDLRAGFRSTTTTPPVRPYVPFSDEALTAGVSVIRAIHITELRQRIDTVRARYLLAPFSWTDPQLESRATFIRAVHVTELRTALSQAYANAGPLPVYTDPVLGAGAPIRRAHIMELRAALARIEQQ